MVTPLLTLFAGETGRDPAAVPSFPPGVVALDDPLTDLPFVLAGSSFSSPMTDTARDGGLDDAGFLNAPSDATLGGGSFITDPAREGAADGGFFASFIFLMTMDVAFAMQVAKGKTQTGFLQTMAAINVMFVGATYMHKDIMPEEGVYFNYASSALVAAACYYASQN